jgi:hypothetical protein
VLTLGDWIGRWAFRLTLTLSPHGSPELARQATANPYPTLYRPAGARGDHGTSPWTLEGAVGSKSPIFGRSLPTVTALPASTPVRHFITSADGRRAFLAKGNAAIDASTASATTTTTRNRDRKRRARVGPHMRAAGRCQRNLHDAVVVSDQAQLTGRSSWYASCFDCAECSFTEETSERGHDAEGGGIALQSIIQGRPSC